MSKQKNKKEKLSAEEIKLRFMESSYLGNCTLDYLLPP